MKKYFIPAVLLAYTVLVILVSVTLSQYVSTHVYEPDPRVIDLFMRQLEVNRTFNTSLNNHARAIIQLRERLNTQDIQIQHISAGKPFKAWLVRRWGWPGYYDNEVNRSKRNVGR